MAATFGAMANSAVTSVGDPSYTSGVHIWNGAAEILKARPQIMNTMPMMKTGGRSWPASASAMPSKSVVPAMP